MKNITDYNTWLSKTRDYCSWICELADDVNNDCQEGGDVRTMDKLRTLMGYIVAAIHSYMIAEELKEGD